MLFRQNILNKLTPKTMDTTGRENSLDVGIFIKTLEGFNEIREDTI